MVRQFTKVDSDTIGRWFPDWMPRREASRPDDPWAQESREAAFADLQDAKAAAPFQAAGLLQFAVRTKRGGRVILQHRRHFAKLLGIVMYRPPDCHYISQFWIEDESMRDIVEDITRLKPAGLGVAEVLDGKRNASG